MKELQEVVNKKVQEMIDDGAIVKTIEDGVSKAIESAFNSQFERYGGVVEQLEKALEEGLQINTKDMPFETYNEQMLVAVKQKVGDLFQGAASERFMSEIDKVLAPAPKQIDIHEFVSDIAAMWKTDEPWDADDLDDYATIEWEEPSWSTDGTSHSLKMWKQRESRFGASRADLELFISNGKILINHKHGYNPTCFSEHDALIFKMYAAGTEITGIADFDENNCELQLKYTDN